MELHIFFGPTASSKTKLAQALWEKTHYPILSVDSRKVYRGADVGTNKLSLLEFAKAHPDILVGGIDFLEPDEEVSAFVYQQAVYRWAVEHFAEIRSAGGLILHGGTGLYLDSILEGRSLLAPRNVELRRELETLPLAQLQARALALVPTNFERLNASDRMNPRRIIRAIENAQFAGEEKVQDGTLSLQNEEVREIFAASTKRWLINIPPREELWKIIDARVLEYYRRGWLLEVESLLSKYGEAAPALKMMGYQQLVMFMKAHDDWKPLAEQNAPEFQEVTATIQLAHRQYAKRQETWGRKYLKIEG